MNLAQFRREARKVMKKNPSDDAIAAVHKELARRKEGLTVSEVWGRRSDYVGKAQSRVRDRKARSSAIDKRLKEERKAMKKNPKGLKQREVRKVYDQLHAEGREAWRLAEQVVQGKKSLEQAIQDSCDIAYGQVLRDARKNPKALEYKDWSWGEGVPREPTARWKAKKGKNGTWIVSGEWGKGDGIVSYQVKAKTGREAIKMLHEESRAFRGPTWLNPKARRNHHLVVGERVKLSNEGWKYLRSSLYPDHPAYFGKVFKTGRPHFGEEWKAARREGLALGERFRRSPTEILGEVVEVRSNGYFIRWDGELTSEGIYGTYSVKDKYVVSAESTSRKWPGNHYEGVNPMAKKNGREKDEALAKQVIAKMRRGGFPDGYYGPSLWGFFEHFYDGTEAEKDAVWEKVNAYYREREGQFTAKNNGRARRNMAIKRMPDGTILADTPKEMMEWMQLEAGSSFQQPKLEGPRLLKAGNLDGGYGGRKLLGGKWAKLEELQASLKYSKPLLFTYSTLMKLIGGTKARHVLSGGKPPKSIQNRTVLMAHGVTPEMAHKFIRLTAGKIPGLLTAKTSARGTAYFTLNQGLLDENPQLTARLFTALQQATVGARKNPKLGASPTIGHAQYYRQPTNAGPYTPQTFPYGYGGRPATYKVAKKNSSARRLGRYAIQMDHDYPGWAQRGPIEANWTSDPTYAYEQFARANGSGPRGGYSSSERDALPAEYFLDPKTRSWPVSDANHAKIAIQYMTRGFGNARTYPTLIRRLAKMYPVTQQGNKAIWSKYNRLRSEIAEKAGKTMPTVAALKKLAPKPYFKAAANRGRRR